MRCGPSFSSVIDNVDGWTPCTECQRELDVYRTRLKFLWKVHGYRLAFPAPNNRLLPAVWSRTPQRFQERAIRHKFDPRRRESMNFSPEIELINSHFFATIVTLESNIYRCWSWKQPWSKLSLSADDWVSLNHKRRRLNNYINDPDSVLESVLRSTIYKLD